MNVYEIVTNEIISKLKEGVVVWQKTWTNGLPTNFSTKKTYRGMNVFLLANNTFKSKYWLTMKQCSELDGSVKSGSKSRPVVFFKWNEKKLDDGTTESYPTLRYFNVFNIEQTTLKIPVEAQRVIKPIDEAKKLVDGYVNKPVINHVGNQPYYIPSQDTIQMPLQSNFKSDEDYYSTLFHELVHSTGNVNRLNRAGFEKGTVHFGSTVYSTEELIAEMGSAFLSTIASINQVTVDNSVAYIQGWLKALENDKRMLVLSSAKAQKAVDYIVGKKDEEKTK